MDRAQPPGWLQGFGDGPPTRPDTTTVIAIGTRERQEVEIEDEPSPVAGWVVVRPLDRWGREYFAASPGAWFRGRVSFEEGIARSRHPDATTVYNEWEDARAAREAVDDTGTAVIAAVLRIPEEDERLENDRRARTRVG